MNLLFTLTGIHGLLHSSLPLESRLILGPWFPSSLLRPLLIILSLRWLVKSFLPILDPRLPASLLRDIHSIGSPISNGGSLRRPSFLNLCLAVARFVAPLLTDQLVALRLAAVAIVDSVAVRLVIASLVILCCGRLVSCMLICR